LGGFIFIQFVLFPNVSVHGTHLSLSCFYSLSFLLVLILEALLKHLKASTLLTIKSELSTMYRKWQSQAAIAHTH
jgi:O-antigen/teichoic acid export membrane protein